ncbi:hypothetical protein ACEPAF_1060 [Sanghuangporus sanghuang]
MSERNVHLLVLVHGMWGNPGHLAEMERIIKETKGTRAASNETDGVELEVLVAHSNRDESTYDGIDWGGERVADEVISRIREVEADGSKVVRFSITGYSLGGLLSRYVIGILYQRRLFSSITPVNFTTFATPHIGLLRSSSIWSSILATLGPKLLSRTGEQFYAVDKWGASGRPLLEILADPKEIFYQALSAFRHVRIYGNVVNDLTVPYVTALIEYEDPFVDRHTTGINVEFDPKYDPIMLSYSIPDEPPVKESPAPLSSAWFQSANPTRYLPPFLQSLRFPLNAIAVVLLPVLFPTFIALLLVRLSLHARSSRARIKLLEVDETHRENALVHAFSRLERELEEAVVDAIEDDQGSNVTATAPPRDEKPDVTNGKLSSSCWDTSAKEVVAGKADGESPKVATDQPLLTPVQCQMVRSLNALPSMTKHRAYIDPLRNSHATIIARDVNGFPFHKRGWGVLQHWADAFVL